MQKGLRSVFLAAFLLLSMAALKAQMSNITFEVDVNGFSGVSAVYITGDANGFDDWCGTCMLMSDPDMDGIYSITVAMAPGTYEYKYNINDWNGTENLVPGSPCTVTNFGFTNRVVTVGTTDFTEGPYCHGTCDTTCSGATLPVQVTFEVDMSNEVVSPAGVFITGQDIDGWCGTCVQMDDPDMDNIFSVTLSMQPGTYEWKYNNGDWNGTETLVPGSPCTMTSGQFTNRVATINNDTTLAHCFETCDIDCSNAATPVNVTFQVDMSNEVVSPAGVFITGQEIDGWCGTCVQMQDPDSNGIYEFTTPLLPGFYEWKYNNGDWAGSETLTAGTPCTFTTDTFTNRAATIGMNDTILPPFCFGSCDITCSPAAPMVDVTFQVDMSEEAISGNGIHLAGSFQGWDPAATPMTHMGNGIFEATVSVMANATHDYLFVNGNVMNAAEEVPLACGVYDGTGGYNRSVIVGGSDMTLAEVCFASCDTCMAAPICQQPVGVTWSNVTSTGATISWSLEPDALVTQIQYRINPNAGGGGAGTVLAGSTATSKVVTGLTPGMPYQARLRHSCGSQLGLSLWKFKPFNTPAARSGLQFEEMSLYPNPASQQMSISYKTEVAFDGVVVVTDLFGRTMKMTNSEFAKGASALSFDVSDLANGIYLLTIQNNNETVISKKFTVAR